MKKFIKKGFYFIAFIILLNAIVLSAYFYVLKITIHDLPALNFSDSYSFNEKIRFMKMKKGASNVLAIGSSMTLNNIHSGTLLANMETKQYLNTSSWGMSMGDNYYYLKSLNSIYPIKRLLIVSNLVDFQQTEKIIDYDFVESYLKSDHLRYLRKIITHFDLKYYIKNLEYARKVRSCEREYDYLKYDEYGTVNLRSDHFKIDKKRWNTDYLDKPGLASQYQYLDSIIQYCKSRGIVVLFFQSPVRAGISNELDQSRTRNLSIHIGKVKQIVENNHQLFVNSGDKPWPDSLFVDAIHFNDTGARLFTEYCFARLKEQEANK